MRKKLVINDHVDVVLEDNGRTHVYIDGKQFIQCMRLVLTIPLETPQTDIASIDDAADKFGTVHEGRGLEAGVHDITIDPETEFFGHCSNIQAWAEHDYDTRLLHSNISFPLLKELAKAGDAKASRVLAADIEARLWEGTATTRAIVFETCYDLFSPELHQKLDSTDDAALKSAYLFERGNKAWEHFDYNGALEAYRAAIKLAPDNAEYHASYADYIARDAFLKSTTMPFNEIETLYRRAIELDPIKVDYHSRFAWYLLAMKLPLVQEPRARQSTIDQVDVETLRVIELAPTDPSSYMDRCNFLSEAKGDIDKAEEMAKKHVELGKNYYGSYLNYTGFLIRHRKDHPDVIVDATKKAVELADDEYSRIETSGFLIDILVALKQDLDDAENICLELINAHPGNARLIGWYATFLLDARLDFTGAEQYFKKAMELQGSASSMLYSIVMPYARFLLITGREIEASGVIDAFLQTPDLETFPWPTRDEFYLAAYWGNYLSSTWHDENVPGDVAMQMKAELARMKELLIQGVRLSKRSNYEVEFAIFAGHPEPDFLRALYHVVTGIQPLETLEDFSTWRDLEIIDDVHDRQS